MSSIRNSTTSPYGDLSKLPHDTKQPDIIASSIVTWLIAAGFVAARFYTKIALNQSPLSASEWSLLVALIASLIVSICQVLEAEYGMGAHIWDLTPANSSISKATECQWISIIFYLLSLAMTKVSILQLYITIFYHTWVRRVSYSILFVIVLSLVWMAYVVFSACTPLEAFWDTTIKGATCHPQSYWLSNQYLLITTDFLTFLLPIPVVWQLKIRTGQKALLLFLFAMGFFVCLISVIRIVILTPTLANAGLDATYNTTPIFHWTAVEVNLAIVVACAMTLKPLISHFLPASMRSWSSRTGATSAKALAGHGSSSASSSPRNALATFGGSGGVGTTSTSSRGHLPPGHIRVDSSFTAEYDTKADEEMANPGAQQPKRAFRPLRPWPFATISSDESLRDAARRETTTSSEMREK